MSVRTYGVNVPPVPKSAAFRNRSTNTATVPMTKTADARSVTRTDGSMAILSGRASSRDRPSPDATRPGASDCVLGLGNGVVRESSSALPGVVVGLALGLAVVDRVGIGHLRGRIGLERD